MKIRYRQDSPIKSPWSQAVRIRIFIWSLVWPILCAWTPKPLNKWRVCILRMFGAKISQSVFIHPKARITNPWNLQMEEHSALGDRAHAYCLGKVRIGKGTTVAQEAYVCTGSHDFTSLNLELITDSVDIGAGTFIGLRAVVLPGVSIGDNVIIGACSVVTRDIPSNSRATGLPARYLPRKN